MTLGSSGGNWAVRESAVLGCPLHPGSKVLRCTAPLGPTKSRASLEQTDVVSLSVNEKKDQDRDHLNHPGGDHLGGLILLSPLWNQSPVFQCHLQPFCTTPRPRQGCNAREESGSLLWWAGCCRKSAWGKDLGAMGSVFPGCFTELPYHRGSLHLFKCCSVFLFGVYLKEERSVGGGEGWGNRGKGMVWYTTYTVDMLRGANNLRKNLRSPDGRCCQ